MRSEDFEPRQELRVKPSTLAHVAQRVVPEQLARDRVEAAAKMNGGGDGRHVVRGPEWTFAFAVR